MTDETVVLQRLEELQKENSNLYNQLSILRKRKKELSKPITEGNPKDFDSPAYLSMQKKLNDEEKTLISLKSQIQEAYARKLQISKENDSLTIELESGIQKRQKDIEVLVLNHVQNAIDKSDHYNIDTQKCKELLELINQKYSSLNGIFQERQKVQQHIDVINNRIKLDNMNEPQRYTSTPVTGASRDYSTPSKNRKRPTLVFRSSQ